MKVVIKKMVVNVNYRDPLVRLNLQKRNLSEKMEIISDEIVKQINKKLNNK